MPQAQQYEVGSAVTPGPSQPLCPTQVSPANTNNRKTVYIRPLDTSINDDVQQPIFDISIQTLMSKDEFQTMDKKTAKTTCSLWDVALKCTLKREEEIENKRSIEHVDKVTDYMGSFITALKKGLPPDSSVLILEAGQKTEDSGLRDVASEELGRLRSNLYKKTQKSMQDGGVESQS